MDLCATPAIELARLIRARELSAAELLAVTLARIGEVNSGINAIVTLAAEQASDLAASVRNPASFCGLVGLRTTPGLIPGDPLDTLGVVGPIARTAADAALLLAGMSPYRPAGPVPGCPWACS